MEARSAQEIWEIALGELQLQVSKPNYRTWLEKTVGLGFQDDKFIVGAPNIFVAEYLEMNQRSLIEKTLINLTRRDVKVTFQVAANPQNSSTGYSCSKAALAQTCPLLFNPKYTFETFIVSNCNRLAHAAAIGVANNPGHSYNPLFIYGGVGLGKTHLLQAIGHEAVAHNVQALYVSAEQFTNEFVTAIRERNTEEFRSKYRSAGMLLIDDIQFISGKEQTEESFFHTFNDLHNADRQIAITSDRPPKAMPLLEDRLRSRFEWGLIADIQPPDFETRLAILRAKAERDGISIAPEVLELIAYRVHQNIRELEGSLNRVVAYARLTRAPLTPELAAQALEDIVSKATKSCSLTPGFIIETVANSFRLSPLDLKGRKRDKNTALARQVAMYLLREKTDLPLVKIGAELGGRDHATVLHAYGKIAGDIDLDPQLRRKILGIQKTIYSEEKSESP